MLLCSSGACSPPYTSSCLLERVVDPGDAVLLHGEQEAARHLRLGGAGVEEGGRGVGEEPLGHEVVRLDNLVDVLLVDAHRHAHDHVLRPLHHLAVGLQQVGPFFSFYFFRCNIFFFNIVFFVFVFSFFSVLLYFGVPGLLFFCSCFCVFVLYFFGIYVGRVWFRYVFFKADGQSERRRGVGGREGGGRDN